MSSWSEAKDNLDAATLFLVHRTGPTVYQIKDEAGNSCRVMIGATHSCTCKKVGFCMHILFVILKVLRIPVTNPLSQKNGFTDAEIEVALAGNFEVRSRPKPQRLKKKKQVDKKDITESTVDRQILVDDDEEICPICQDDMKIDHALTWCRKGCGNNIHAKCMKMYAQYKSTTKKDILCPLCRENWGPMAMHIINDDCKGKISLKKACAVVICKACTFPVRGSFSRCVECSMYGSDTKVQATEGERSTISEISNPVDFCQSCFKNIGRSHAKHHFMRSTTNSTVRDFAWEYVKNPRAPQPRFAADFLENIQNRELTNDDYDFLLDLDKPQHVTVQDILIDSMQTCSRGDMCWCGKEVNSETARTLVCGHAAHVECCREQLNEAIEEGFWKLEEIKCLHASCGCPLFKGLGRKRKNTAKKSDSADLKNANVKDVCGRDVGGVPLLSTDFVIAGAGLGATATGVATSVMNERSEHALVIQTRDTAVSSANGASMLAENHNEATEKMCIQSGRLPPRQTTRDKAQRVTARPGMKRGLALSGKGQLGHRSDNGASTAPAIPGTISLQGTTRRASSAVTSFGVVNPTSVMRTSSATGTTSSIRGTSSFVPTSAKRRVATQLGSGSMRDDILSSDIDGLCTVLSSSSLHSRSGQQIDAISDSGPVGLVPPRRSVVGRIRGSVFADRSSGISRALGIALQDSPDDYTTVPAAEMCLHVRQY
mmetsp:Transcript_13249/g.21693  ORF Transcript_13249/g.21693 Transcript_13249/m.21693 type:complete len:714 (-) Transcript_13249:1407-3548(-)